MIVGRQPSPRLQYAFYAHRDMPGRLLLLEYAVPGLSIVIQVKKGSTVTVCHAPKPGLTLLSILISDNLVELDACLATSTRCL